MNFSRFRAFCVFAVCPNVSFLSPAALWFLLVLGPLVWLWRFTQTRRTIVIPSLAPFRQLREQRPTSQWVPLNLLLMLQTLLLIALVGALAQPRLHGKWWARPHQTRDVDKPPVVERDRCAE